MTSKATMSFEEAHGIARGAIALADPERIPGPDTEAAVAMIQAIPREHMIKLSRWAIAQRNTDGIDVLSEVDQRRAVLAEKFMRAQLSEEELAQVLGIKI